MTVIIDATEEQRLKKIIQIMYILEGLASFSFLTGVAAIIMNYIVLDTAAINPVYQSHLKWLRRTFWYSLVWLGVGIATWIFLIGMVIVPLTTVWVLYRVIKGWVLLGYNMPIPYSR